MRAIAEDTSLARVLPATCTCQLLASQPRVLCSTLPAVTDEPMYSCSEEEEDDPVACSRTFGMASSGTATHSDHATYSRTRPSGQLTSAATHARSYQRLTSES